MPRISRKFLSVCGVLTLVLVAKGQAQPHQHQPSGRPPAPPGQQAPAEAEKPEHDTMTPPMRGMMGHGGRMLQQHVEQLAQQLKLSEEQRVQTRTLLRQHMKEVIRLRAEIDTMTLDVAPFLEAEAVDLAQVKQLFHSIAAQEADLRLAHLTAMQDIRKLLTPEQQKQFRAMPGHMLGDGGMMGLGGGMGHGGMRERGSMRERSPRAQ